MGVGGSICAGTHSTTCMRAHTRTRMRTHTRAPDARSRLASGARLTQIPDPSLSSVDYPHPHPHAHPHPQPAAIAKMPIAPWLTVVGRVTLATVFELSTGIVCAKTYVLMLCGPLPLLRYGVVAT